MLLQTNSYIVPADRRLDHQRLIRRFRQVMTKLGCESFEVYEQAGPNWGAAESTGRFVQIMRFRDRQHQRQVQNAERNDPAAQALIAEFCELINLPYQQQQGFFAVGFYISLVAAMPALQQAPGTGEGGGAEAAAAEAQPPAGEAVEDAPAELAPEPVEPMQAVEAEAPSLTEPEAGVSEDSQAEIEIEQVEIAPAAEPRPAEETEAGQAEPAAGAPYSPAHETVPGNHQPTEGEDQEPQDLVFEEPPADEPGGESAEEFDIESITEQEVGGFEQAPEEQQRKE